MLTLIYFLTGCKLGFAAIPNQKQIPAHTNWIGATDGWAIAFRLRLPCGLPVYRSISHGFALFSVLVSSCIRKYQTAQLSRFFDIE
jgi:hypothetical protein